MSQTSMLLKNMASTTKHLAFTANGTRSASSYTISQKGLNLLADIESFSGSPYDDQTGKTTSVWVKGATIGYGHLIAKLEWPKYAKGISKAQALVLFKKDLADYINAVKNHVTSLIKQNEFDALVIFSYNIGVKAFVRSDVLRLVNNPKIKTPYANLEQAWNAWNKSQGKINLGLKHRRQSEWNIYSHNVYKKW